MKIGILGSGNVAQKLGEGFLRAGHEVKLGTRSPGKLAEWQKPLGEKSSIGSFQETANFGDLIVLATHGVATLEILKSLDKNNLKNKVVIDVTNPLDFSQGMPPKFTSSPGKSLGEQIQKFLNESKVVKAFNTISANRMCAPALEEGDPDLLICGNDENAKSQVAEIAKNFGWKSIIDMGDISKAFLLEATAMLWIDYGFKYNHWTHAFKILKK